MRIRYERHTSLCLREYKSYTCNKCRGKTYRCDKIDNLVIENINKIILTDDNIQKMIEKAKKELEKQKHTATGKEMFLEQIESIDAKIDRITDAIADIGLTASLKQKLDELNADRAEIASKIVAMNQNIEDISIAEKQSQTIVNKILLALNDPDLPLIEKKRDSKNFYL